MLKEIINIGDNMTENQKRILIFGAGTIGSAYAINFIEAGIDVTMFARSNRFQSLKQNGLRYSEKGTVKTIKVNVIDKIKDDDVYDFILLTVRYDQAKSALATLKDNTSKTIVTMTNSSTGFSSWLEIVGDRLLPGFPGVGGHIKDDILYARFPPKGLASALIGEIDGVETERVKDFIWLFDTAKLPCKINPDMKAFLITHSATDIAMVSVLHTGDNITDKETLRSAQTARQITVTLKKYLNKIQEAGIVINPAFLKNVLKLPNFVLDSFFKIWLRSKIVEDMLTPSFANSATKEVRRLEEDLLNFLNHQ